MKIVQINALDFGSTGKIMLNIAEKAREAGCEVYTFSSSRKATHPKAVNHFYIDNKLDYYFHMIAGMVSGLETSFSFFATRRLINTLKKIKPDIVHLHNTHGFYLNHPLFFKYLKESGVKVVWTLHDCWAFTGRCPYFQITGCDRWKVGCGKCVYKANLYPASYFFDLTRRQYKEKKELFSGIRNMTIVTPSCWLAGLVKESFLGDYPIRVINNGIDLSIFKPTESDFCRRHHIPGGKFIILGVAFSWGYRKGLDVFVELSKRLEPNTYQIVLVGTNENIDQELSSEVITIHRTSNQKELAEIYTAADVFVNPTREDNFPTVNMESIACGTPVITFKTGGSPEIIDTTCGCTVPCDDVDGLEKQIIDICEKHRYNRDDCVKKARQFDINDRFREYIDLYKAINNTLSKEENHRNL